VTYTIHRARGGRLRRLVPRARADYYHDSFFVSRDGGTEDIYDARRGPGARTGSGRASTDAATRSAAHDQPRVFYLSRGTHHLKFRTRNASRDSTA
jgi:hypothetical protein